MGLEPGGLTWDPVLSTPSNRSCSVLSRWARAFKCGALLAAARVVGASSALPLVLALLLLWKWNAGLCGRNADAAEWRRWPLTDSGSQQSEELWLSCRNSGDLLDCSFCFFLLFVVEFPPLICALLVGADKPQVIYNWSWSNVSHGECILCIYQHALHPLWWLRNEESACHIGDLWETRALSLGWEGTPRRKWQCTPLFLAFLVAQMVKSLPAMQKTWVRPLSREEPLEAGMTTHYSILTWRIPWTDWWATVHGVTVGHNRATNTSTFQAGGREVEGCWGRRRGVVMMMKDLWWI